MHKCGQVVEEFYAMQMVFTCDEPATVTIWYVSNGKRTEFNYCLECYAINQRAIARNKIWRLPIEVENALIEALKTPA